MLTPVTSRPVTRQVRRRHIVRTPLERVKADCRRMGLRTPVGFVDPTNPVYCSMRRRAQISLRRYVVVTETLTSGSSWTAPANLVKGTLYVECEGGSAGGRGGVFLGSGGGGGGGGAYAAGYDTSVGPGDTPGCAIGAAGSPSNFNSSSGLTAGGDTSWHSGVVLAKGGGIPSSSTGGTGGQASGSTGTTKVSGSNGANGSGANGGAGGNGATSGSIAGGTGGGGGDGSTAGENGSTNGGHTGNAPGGGGGGGRNLTNGDGAHGAIGRIVLTYTVIY